MYLDEIYDSLSEHFDLSEMRDDHFYCTDDLNKFEIVECGENIFKFHHGQMSLEFTDIELVFYEGELSNLTLYNGDIYCGKFEVWL